MTGKRGPKRKDGKRAPSGRLSQAKDEVIKRVLETVEREDRDTLTTALEARMRVYGVNPAECRDQMAGSVVGRLCLSGVVTRIQYDAAMEWLADRQAYLVAVAPAQGTEPRAVNLNSTHGSSNYENESAARQAVEKYRQATKAMQGYSTDHNYCYRLSFAMDAILVRDHQLQHLVGDLRHALNALAKHYGLNGRMAA